MSFRNACYHILAPASEAHEYKKLSKLFDIFLIALIIVNVVAMMLETVPGIPAIWRYELHIIEVASVLIFTAEYFLRVYSSASAPNRPTRAQTSTWQKRWAYIKSPMALIDLMAILPFYLSEISRYSRSIQTLATVLRNEAHSLVAALSVLILFTVIAATCIYYIEHAAQPNVFSSIPASLWWALVTLTTVGYGDAVPVTALGKVFGGLITIMGICFYALPAGILSSSYTAQMQLKRDRFKDTVRSVLDDGKLSEHDVHHLEHVRALLDLDEEEAKLIVRLLQHHHKGLDD